MGKYNISNYKKYKFDNSVTIAICDIGKENCLATDIPNTVKTYFLYDENNNAVQANICKNCSAELSLLQKIETSL